MDLFIDVDNKKIDFNVQYRNRKTMSIQIEPTGKVLVAAPQGLSEEKIVEVVRGKGRWIVRKLEELKEIDYKSIEKTFVDGEGFLYLGEEYPLQIEVDKDIKVTSIMILRGNLYIKTPVKDVNMLRQAVEKWYREKCLIKVMERVDYYKEIVGKNPIKVRVKEQKRRWGSCTSRGHILFNWRCIMAPLDVIDYIVVHEMCHLIHMNHSKAFWELVEYILPDHKERRNWLKKYGVLLNI